MMPMATCGSPAQAPEGDFGSPCSGLGADTNTEFPSRLAIHTLYRTINYRRVSSQRVIL